MIRKPRIGVIGFSDGDQDVHERTKRYRSDSARRHSNRT